MTRRRWHTCQPIDLHSLARQWFIDAKRIELQKLAVELGISRATAYRWAGSAEQLVGEVLASLVDETFRQVVQRTTSTGSDRVFEVLERGMQYAHRFRPLRQFLANNAQLGLKIVASRHSPVQERTIANLKQLLEQEVRGGYMTLPVEPAVMAYALTRIVESFLYADLIIGATPDLANASKILKLMLRQDAPASVVAHSTP
ncbi:MAG: QsdR family transcriptional regulator [Gammaproteobacteria bacterium]|nr:QsdR family transcriptional regulator [Gammaproteobacteria bacterium]